MQVAMQLGPVGDMTPKLVMRRPDQRESPIVEDCLYGGVGREDAWLERRID
jgi:hypothetical protein